MADVIIPQKLMLNKLNKSKAWHHLGLTEWTNQIGLLKSINETTGMSDYYVQNKGDYKLWDFILYVDSKNIPPICSYYGFPNDIREFLSFCFNDVAADYDWKEKTDKRQMDYFPYEYLYSEIWQKKLKFFAKY